MRLIRQYGFCVHDARQAVLLGQAHEFVHAVGRFVRQPDGTHLARLHQPASACSWSWIEVCGFSCAGS
jgi:hypothetical protein